MKTLTSEVLAVGAWGLHLTSFIVASIPYLQAASLILAIVVSIFTLHKLVKDSNQKRKNKDGKIY
jgi:hypothetical protein